MKVGIVATFKNESDYIIEWVSYHLSIGIDSFYIANNNSTDDTEVLLSNLQSKGVIKYINYDTPVGYTGNPQIEVYNKIGHDFKSEVDWMLFIDADEFIILDEEFETIHEAIAHIDVDSMIGLVTICWALYGSSYNISRNHELSIKRFTLRDVKPDKHYKSLVRSVAFDKFEGNPHFAHIAEPYYAINTNGETLRSIDKFGVMKNFKLRTWSNMRINHYAIRSLEEFTLRKQARGRATTNAKRLDNFFLEHDKNDTCDTLNNNRIKVTEDIYAKLLSNFPDNECHMESMCFNNYRFTSLNKYSLTALLPEPSSKYYRYRLIVDDGAVHNIFLFYDFNCLVKLDFITQKSNFFLDKHTVAFDIDKHIIDKHDNIYICLNRMNNNLGDLIKIGNFAYKNEDGSLIKIRSLIKQKLRKIYEKAKVTWQYRF